tara:strand:+ start:268 stop:504 length:237 start_codon:yes stop_codon:yes gene_type:complete
LRVRDDKPFFGKKHGADVKFHFFREFPYSFPGYFLDLRAAQCGRQSKDFGRPDCPRCVKVQIRRDAFESARAVKNGGA